MSQQREPQTGQQEPTTGRSIEVKTLVIAAAAAVAAAVITSAFWQRGALISTALTPVIVALVQEVLRRPAERVSATASRVAATPVRGAGAVAGVGGRRGPDPARFEAGRLASRETSERTASGGDEWNGAGANGSGPPPNPPLGGPPASTEPPAPRIYRRRRFRWKIALATGIAAFVVAVGVLTASELALGGSVAADGGTTLFSGGAGDGADSGSPADPSQSDSEESAAPTDSSDSQAVPDEDPDAEEPPTEEPPPSEEPVPSEEPPPSE
jgi:hypothetical protein